MGNDKLITLRDGDNIVDNVELICAFEIEGFIGKYIIYTKNEKDNGGNTIIYSGKVNDFDGKQFLENVDEGIEWEKLKSIMKSMARYSLDGESYVQQQIEKYGIT